MQPRDRGGAASRLEEIVQERHAAGLLLKRKIITHRQIPMALGSGAQAASLDQKLLCMCKKFLAETHTHGLARSIMHSVCAFCDILCDIYFVGMSCLFDSLFDIMSETCSGLDFRSFPLPCPFCLLFGIFGWCFCLPLALFFGELLLADVCCSWSLSLLGRCFLSLPVQCCWVPLRRIGTSCEIQVSRTQVGDKRITYVYNQAVHSTQTVVREHTRNASPETEAKSCDPGLQPFQRSKNLETALASSCARGR